MDAKKIRSSLDLDTFSLDFLVELDESIDCTESFRPPGIEDYVFAAGEIWLRTSEQTSLLIEQRSGANLISTLTGIRHEISSLRLIHGLEKRISLGGWCHWMQGYWDRLNADSCTEDDEAVYDLLIPALLVEGRCGRIVAYRYGGSTVLEACTRPSEGAALGAYSKFVPDVLSASIKKVSSKLSDAIRVRL